MREPRNSKHDRVTVKTLVNRTEASSEGERKEREREGEGERERGRAGERVREKVKEVEFLKKTQGRTLGAVVVKKNTDTSHETRLYPFIHVY